MKHPIKQLVNDAKFSPSLIDTVVRTKNSLSKAQRIRAIALVFALLTVGVNILMYVAPPDNSLASSTNDLIGGGLGKNENRAKKILIQALKNNQNPSGRQEEELQAIYRHYDIKAKDILNSKETDICLSCDEKLYVISREQVYASTQESTVTEGGITYYAQPLTALQSENNIEQSVKALEIRKGLFVLYDSGNIVFSKKSKPLLSLNSSLLQNDTANSATTESHRFVVKNIGEYKAIFSQLEISLPDKSELVEYSTGGQATNYYQSSSADGSSSIVVEWDKLNIQDEQIIDVVIKKPLEQPEYCLEANLHSLETNATSNKSCVTNLSSTEEDSLTGDSELSVSAINTTTGVEASKAEARAGEIIRYDIKIINPNNYRLQDYEIASTDISDIAEYAEISDIKDGIVVDDRIQWSVISLEPGESMVRSFIAKIHKDIPSTTKSASDPNSYDCKLTSVVGNTVLNIGLKCGITKEVEQSVNSLPYINSLLIVSLLASTALLSWFMYNEHRHLFLQLELIHNQHMHRK